MQTWVLIDHALAALSMLSGSHEHAQVSGSSSSRGMTGTTFN